MTRVTSVCGEIEELLIILLLIIIKVMSLPVLLSNRQLYMIMEEVMEKFMGQDI